MCQPGISYVLLQSYTICFRAVYYRYHISCITLIAIFIDITFVIQYSKKVFTRLTRRVNKSGIRRISLAKRMY
jgi:hypothetical protein